ncbi:MAG: helix-turn-helix domain-containing protein [Planctomycetota bacterium]|jgi:excisionase family DNA binding protein
MTERTPALPTDAGPPCLGLRPKDAAKALGISERKLWELTADRTSGIPHTRCGKTILYPVRELTEWLAQCAARDSKQ